MRVYLVASTALNSSYKTFLRDRGVTWRESKLQSAGQRIIELAGRVCYFSFGKLQSSKSNSQYIRHLIDQGHESVLEHAHYSILADRISRGLSHQLVRHRAGFAFSQLSQQYHDESDSTFVEPIGIGRNSPAMKEWKSAITATKSVYIRLQQMLSNSKYAEELGKKERIRAIRSLARTVLPNATSTTLVITGNARAWRHLLTVRGAISGDFEMRDFCVRTLRLLKRQAPDLFREFEVRRDPFGSFVSRNL